MGAVFVLGLATAQLVQRKAEGRQLAMVLHPLAPDEPDSSKFKANYPREYNSWEKTKISEGDTKYGGPSKFSWFGRDPNKLTLWAGYPFSVEYNDERGHYWAVTDVKQTKRHRKNNSGEEKGGVFPGTCWTCKSTDVPVLMKQMGVENFYSSDFWSLEGKINHTIGCADCHDGETMNLRISRPALKEAFAAQGKDISKASHQEMRSLVCAQCHVEYYFKGPGKYLTFPWAKGTKFENIEAYYDDEAAGFADWTHDVSKTKMVKMQHPDYEVYLTGIHAYRGVSCADCHMPYRSEGGVKFTDHHVQSPLKNIANSCAVCHRWSEEEIRSRVEGIQDKHHEMLQRAGDAIAAAHKEVGEAIVEGLSDDELAKARDLIRRAQMRWDFVDANNGMGFHSPQESARVLAAATDMGQQARLAVAQARLKRLGKQ
jgi:nitrite reductase (cytochrome c-552)